MGRSFTERDEARLKQDLADYLKPRPLDLEQLSRVLFDLDRDRNGFLSMRQVNEMCSDLAGLALPRIAVLRLYNYTIGHLLQKEHVD